VDSSANTVGAALLQSVEGQGNRPIAFASQRLTATQKASSTIEKEAYAAIWALQKFRNWIFGQPTTVIYSDHNPLTYITEFNTKSAKLMRWLLSVQSYNVTFKYKEGRKNVVADCLSRLDSATEWRWPGWRITIVTLWTNVLLFCMCYAVYDGIGETCWCWDATPQSNSWVMTLVMYKRWNQWCTSDEALELCYEQWSLHQRCLLVWRLVYVTFGIVTLPRRFRLGIVFGGEVWRSSDSPSYAADLCWTSFTYLLWFLYIVQFGILVYFRCRCIWKVVTFRLHVWLTSCIVSRVSRIDFSRCVKTI